MNWSTSEMFRVASTTLSSFKLVLRRLTSDMVNIYDLNSRKVALYACGLSVAYLVSRKVLDVARRKYYNYPPGEIGLPLLGCFLPFATMFEQYGACKPNNYLQRLSKRNGAISMVKLGFKDCVIIHDYDVIRQVASKPPFMIHTYKLSEHFDELGSLNGSEYLQRRSVLLQSFVSVMNPNYLVNHCLDCFPKIIYPNLDRIAHNGSVGDNVTKALENNMDYVLFQSIFIVLFGKTGVVMPEKTSEEYKRFIKILHTTMNDIEFHLFMNVALPSWIVKIIGLIFGSVSDSHTKFVNMVDKWVQEHYKSHRGKNEFSAVDKMLQLMQEYQVYDVSILAGTVFEASIQTTQQAVMRCIISLARDPDIQNRVYEEMKQTILQHSITPDDDDYPMSLFRHGTFACLKACVYETVRMVTVVGPPRTIIHKGVGFGGYNFPRGATLLFDCAAADSHEKFWKGDTSKFEIDRWLKTNSDGSVIFEENKYYAAFGIGKRSCPGKSVGTSNAYLFLGMILARYRFTMDANENIKITKR